jgi:hypothetical protein
MSTNFPAKELDGKSKRKSNKVYPSRIPDYLVCRYLLSSYNRSFIIVLLKERSEIQLELLARHQWLTPVILAIQEAEIRRIQV